MASSAHVELSTSTAKRCLPFAGGRARNVSSHPDLVLDLGFVHDRSMRAEPNPTWSVVRICVCDDCGFTAAVDSTSMGGLTAEGSPVATLKGLKGEEETTEAR